MVSNKKTPATKKPAAPRKPARAKPAKVLDPAVQASQQALAKALAAAKAAKITQPLGKPAKSKPVESPAPKRKKAKPVRDKFTMPENEYAQIAMLKKRLLDQGVRSKKSALLRAGMALLAALPDDELLAAVAKIETGKTGASAKTGE